MIFMTYCSSPEETVRTVHPYLHCPCPLVLAHQGASGEAPSSTMLAFQRAKERATDILELDVHMSRDGVLIVSHDRTVDRFTDGTGPIQEKSLAELKLLDAGYDFSPDNGRTHPYRGRGLRLMTLEEVFSAFPDTRFLIEIKQTEPPIEEELWRLVRAHNREDTVMMGSFRHAALERWRRITAGRVATSASSREMMWLVFLWKFGLAGFWEPEMDALQIPYNWDILGIDLTDRELIDLAHANGLQVHYWTVNDEADMQRLLAAGADGIITDYPDRARMVIHNLQ